MSHKAEDTWAVLLEARRPDDMYTEAAVACRDLASIITIRVEKLEEIGPDFDLSMPKSYAHHLEELAKKLERAAWHPRGPEEPAPLPMERMWFRHRLDLYSRLMDVARGAENEVVLESAFGYTLVLKRGADLIEHRWHDEPLWQILRAGSGFHWQLWHQDDQGVAGSLPEAMRAAQQALDSHLYGP